MSFAGYDTMVNDAMAFIRRMRATGTFCYTATIAPLDITSDDHYIALTGQVNGALGQLGITEYSQLEARVFGFTDVEYKANWQYEYNAAWWDADLKRWRDSWHRDTSIGNMGQLDGYAQVRSDGSFGGIEILGYNTWTHQEGGTYTAPYKRRYLLYPSNPKVRLHRLSDGYLAGGADPNDRIWQGYAHISHLTQPDDPAFDVVPPAGGYRLNTRCWIYSEAVVVLAYIATGNYAEAKETLKRLALEQYTAENSPDPNYIGGWPFSFDVYFGRIPMQDYLRNGAICWTIWAFLMYQLKTGDTYFANTINLALNYLLKEQITDMTDNRYGLIPLGWNRYAQPGYYLDYRRETSCSIEHNVDAWQVFSLAYTVTGDAKYKMAADLVEMALLNKALSSSKNRFYQGVRPTDADNARALDCSSWGGLFLTAIQNHTYHASFVSYIDSTYQVSGNVSIENDPAHFNLWYSLAQTVTGYKPYQYFRSDQPESVWIEGTLGVIAYLMRTGIASHATKAKGLIDNTISALMYQLSGSHYKGLIGMTRAYNGWPWEMSINPSVTNNAWFVVILKAIDMLWSPRAKNWRIRGVAVSVVRGGA